MQMKTKKDLKESRVKAYAKINLVLDVIGKRNDGYHEVAMVMQGINLYDVVTINKSIQGIEITTNKKDLETGRENLAYQAAAILSDIHYPKIKGVAINIDKRIPIAAGLGGGSADAAAVLLGMNHLFELGHSYSELQKFAAKIGSDVPFCLRPFTSLAQGRGELITELSSCPVLWLVLLKPPFGVSTKSVYQQYDYIKSKTKPDMEKTLKAITSNSITDLYQVMDNALEDATFSMYPQLKNWADDLGCLGAERVMMSGSGPTLIAFMQSEQEAVGLASRYNKTGWYVEVTRTLKPEEIEGMVEIR